MRRIWLFAHPMLTLAALGCCAYMLFRPVPSPPTTNEDRPLRALLGAHWLGGDYELPPDEEHCAVALVEFRNGRFEQRVFCTPWSVHRGDASVVPVVAMWHTQAGTSTIAFSTPNTVSRVTNHNCSQLQGGGLVHASRTEVVAEWHGYRILGMATSEALGNGDKAGYFSGQPRELTMRAFALALILKPCGSRQEAEDWCVRSDFTWPTE